ncbi:MAG: hypothetical protein NT154_16875, partial [Verrucomicrobia bacterium]|nr:hypothetical protein [Verrucomicrobiota bacterium]
PAPSRSKRWSKCGEKCCPATITPRAWPAAAVVSSENFVAQDQLLWGEGRGEGEQTTTNCQTIPKHQRTNVQDPLPGVAFGALGHLIFGFVSGLGFRISDLRPSAS